MVIGIITFIALVMVSLDFIAYRRLRANATKRIVIWAFLSVVSISYLAILIVPVLMHSITGSSDNSVAMKGAMCLLTTSLTLLLPRLLLYLIWLPTRRKSLMYVAVSVSSLLLVYFLCSVFYTRTNYKINDVEIHFRNLPALFDGYRIAFISDIHVGTMISPAKELGEVIGLINGCGADMVLFGGDFINMQSSELTEPLIAVLAHLKARDGVLMVIGNHDTGAYAKIVDNAGREANIRCLQTKMQRAGWCMLRDSTVYVCRGTDSIAVTGIDYSGELLKYRHSMDIVDGLDFSHIYDNVPDSVFNITLSHLPQLWHLLCDGGYSDLTLSGHIHAMQMKIGSLSPARLMYKEWSGLYESEKGKLYINDGIGCVGYLARFGAPPEITLITLRCE